MMRITRDCLLSGNANRRSWMALVAPSANELTQAAATLDIPRAFCANAWKARHRAR